MSHTGLSYAESSLAQSKVSQRNNSIESPLFINVIFLSVERIVIYVSILKQISKGESKPDDTKGH